MDLIAEIESHFSCRLPIGFRRWTRSHYTDPVNHSDNYLWVDEAEWIPPAEITIRELYRDRHIAGLVPFAFTGGADYWCFNTASPTAEFEYEILRCNTDDDADVYAPSFASWFYRTCLHSCVCIAETELEESREHLSKWAARLAEIDSGPWPDHLMGLSRKEPFRYPNGTAIGLVREADVQRIVATEIGSRYVDTQVPWGWYLDDYEDA